MNFSIEKSEENDLIKQYAETPERGQFQNPFFSLTVQPVRINNRRTPLLGLAKSIYYSCKVYQKIDFYSGFYRLAESDNLQPGERQRWVHLDIQHAVRNWQIRQQPNYGLMLKIKKEYSANAVMKFASSDHPLEHLHPKLKVCLTIHPW